MLSAIENRMSSLLMKSEIGISSTSWFKKVPGWRSRQLRILVSTKGAYLASPEPLLTVIRLLLAERQVDELAIALLCLREWNDVLLRVAEVVTSVRVLARTQTLSDLSAPNSVR